MSKRTDSGERMTLHMSFSNSAIFSEAYFILRPLKESGASGDIVAEARRIIREYNGRMTAPKAAFKKDTRSFLSGVFAGVAASAAVVFAVAVFMC